jgi:DNA invertase Pin-like site-specific DNA recombinase
VGFVSLKETLDFTTPTGRLMFQLLCAFSEFERELIRERVVAGIRNAKNKGAKLGRPPISKDLAAKIIDLKGQGLSFRAISKMLDVHRATVHKTYQNSLQET